VRACVRACVHACVLACLRWWCAVDRIGPSYNAPCYETEVHRDSQALPRLRRLLPAALYMLIRVVPPDRLLRSIVPANPFRWLGTNFLNDFLRSESRPSLAPACTGPGPDSSDSLDILGTRGELFPVFSEANRRESC
jgi:hypothetical protein